VKTRCLVSCCLAVCSAVALFAAAEVPSFKFKGADYWHRWSQNHQHEFTPEHQEDLEKWVDMVTINIYPAAHDGDALAKMANAVLENYKSHKATVLTTKSVPRTPDHPAEHLIAVVFSQPKFIEVAFARFKLAENTGCSIVYSHRLYRGKMGDQMGSWLKSNYAETEKALMEWSSMPPQASLEGLKL
jgi:hypothetical protein